jgi:phosphatidylglycerol:prolipoprotein diacylglycerol transferase
MLVAQMVGRIGCFINGDAYGKPTTLPWGLVYTNEGAFIPRDWIRDRVATHPAPVYEILWDLLVLAVIWQLRRRIKPGGALFVLYLMLYSLGRFFISYLRMDPIVVLGLQQAQIISLLVLVIGAFLLAYLYRRERPARQR